MQNKKMNSKGLVLDIIISFVLTLIILTALSPVIVAFDSTFLTGSGVNTAAMGIFYYFIYAVPLFLVIGGIVLVAKSRLKPKE